LTIALKKLIMSPSTIFYPSGLTFSAELSIIVITQPISDMTVPNISNLKRGYLLIILHNTIKAPLKLENNITCENIESLPPKK
jgi:hypothetical protein